MSSSFRAGPRERSVRLQLMNNTRDKRLAVLVQIAAHFTCDDSGADGAGVKVGDLFLAKVKEVYADSIRELMDDGNRQKGNVPDPEWLVRLESPSVARFPNDLPSTGLSP